MVVGSSPTVGVLVLSQASTSKIIFFNYFKKKVKLGERGASRARQAAEQRGAGCGRKVLLVGNMDSQGIEPWASRMLSGCDTTTPTAQLMSVIAAFQLTSSRLIIFSLL